MRSALTADPEFRPVGSVTESSGSRLTFEYHDTRKAAATKGDAGYGAQRSFTESLHPRGAKGTANGGEFAAGSGGGSTAKTQAKPAGPLTKTLAYDPHSKRGPGYGVHGGDPHVRQLQEALNRLGAVDSNGKRLGVDGDLGPLTTSAIERAQKALGLKADGKVTPALLASLMRVKSLPGIKPLAAAAHKTPAHAPTHHAPVGHPTTHHTPAAPKAPVKKPAMPDRARGGGSHASARSIDMTEADMDQQLTADSLETTGHESGEPAAGRSVQLTYSRVFGLDGIEILSRGKGGDGRTVEAYAAVFGVKKEIRDQHGHYIEDIDPTSFNRTIKNGAVRRSLVLYNHGLDARGKSGGLPTVPIGKPVSVEVDGRGLRTISRYNESEFASMVLDSIRNGDITAQSFEGPIYRSNPAKVPAARRGGALPNITRMELGLSNYGPTPTPYYPESEITAVRSAADLADAFAALDAEQREELIRTLASTPGWDSETAAILATPHRGPGAEDPRDAHSMRLKMIRLKAEMRARSL